MRKRLITGFVIGTLLLTGCSGGSADSSNSSTSSTTATSSPTDTSTLPEQPTSSDEPGQPIAADVEIDRPETARGANAAPQAGQVSGIYDASEAAVANFRDWWEYEHQTDAARNRPFDSVYTDGVLVCSRRALGYNPDALAGYFGTTKGYQGDGAALVAAALRSLCTQHGEGNAYYDRIDGYLTYFDKNVNVGYAALKNDPNLRFTGGYPSLYQVGWFAKFACYHLQTNADGSNLLPYLRQYSKERYGTSYLAEADQRTVEIITVHLVRSVCLGYLDKLGYGWHN